jgi:hypothetical protein
MKPFSGASHALMLLGTVLWCSSAAYAEPVARITMQETRVLLEKDPQLKGGFTTAQGHKLHVLKPVKGGVAVQFKEANGEFGDLTVLGPPAVIGRDTLSTIIDVAIAVWDKLKGSAVGGGSGSGAGSGGGGNNNNGCVNVNFNGSIGSGSTVTVVVNGNQCSPP